MIIFNTKTTPYFYVLLQVLYHQFNTKTHTFLKEWGVRKLQMPHLHWQLFMCIRQRLRHHWWTCQPITESTHYNCAASAERIPRAGPAVPPPRRSIAAHSCPNRLHRFLLNSVDIRSTYETYYLLTEFYRNLFLINA